MTKNDTRWRVILACTATAALALGACGGGSSTAGGEGAATSGGESAVAPIPSQYGSITPAIVVTDVDAALAFYERALGATTTLRVPGPGGSVLHGEMRVGDSIVMLGPENEEHGERAPVNAGGATAALFVYVEDADAAIARAVEAGAEQLMPATDMFWGDRYGQVRDPSGHRWSFATHRFDVDPAEMARRAEAFSAAMASGGPPPTFEGGTPATSWKPEGYRTVTPELVVSGPDAIDFYVRALGATERDRALTPDGRLMHGEIRIGDEIVMLGGEFPESAPDVRTPEHVGATTMTIMHYVPDADAAMARAVEAGAVASMPIDDMFWGDRMGGVRDPSGHVWAIATHVRDVSPEEMEAVLAEIGAQPAE